MNIEVVQALARLPDLDSRVYLVTKDNSKPVICDVLGYYLTTKGNYARLSPVVQPRGWVGNQSYYYKVSLLSFGKSWFSSLAEAEIEVKRRSIHGK